VTSALLLLLAQAVPADADADRAVAAWRAACAGAMEDARIAALKTALETPHEKVLRAVAEVFTADTEKVRLAAAPAFGEVDHPAAVDALVAALLANYRRPEVLKVLLDALAELGWQRACPALEKLVAQVAAEDVREVLPEVLELLGKLGAVSSIGPLCDLLRKIEGPKKSGWSNERRLHDRALSALAAITGMPFRKGADCEDWWRSNAAALKPTALRVYWLPKTHERVAVAPHEKAPADAVLVWSRLTEPSDAQSKKDRKKRKKDSK
jgi:hypothetical protein